VLAALEFVDAVVLAEADEASNLAKALQPGVSVSDEDGRGTVDR
jgi:bifunctional ADP-heptose synthase (sugar kinase/adenylyltransferase)